MISNEYQLIREMKRVNREEKDDPESNHGKMDQLLLDYIGNEKVRQEFDKLPKWYA
jgi:hypothetical protein